MKLPTVLAMVISLGVAVSACSSSRTPVVELPGGVPEQTNERERNYNNRIDRWLGNDRRPNAGPCPLMGVLYESSRLVAFADPSVQTRYNNIAYTGEMQGIRGLCRYVDADPIQMSIEVDMAFGRGPAMSGNSQTYRYWVAVARRGRAPIEKAYFDVDVRFDRNEQVVTVTEEIDTIVIPRANEDVSGENFEILVGFELTPQQLQFNREGRRFRIDSAGNQR